MKRNLKTQGRVKIEQGPGQSTGKVKDGAILGGQNPADSGQSETQDQVQGKLMHKGKRRELLPTSLLQGGV